MPIKHLDNVPDKENAIRKYYDHNTKMFLKHGEHGKTYGIHQPLFLKPTDSVETAMHAQHNMILNLMSVNKSQYNVLDLGCGVGSSLMYLAKQSPSNVEFKGISISRAQIEFAMRNLNSTIHKNRIEFVCASYQQMPTELKCIDLAYAIESFIHSPDVNVFFQQVSSSLKPGGQLVIFDDFLSRNARTGRGKRALREFHHGWKANNLHQASDLVGLAHKAHLQLQQDVDLTSYLKLGRPRDKIIAIVASILRIVPTRNQYTTFLLGGNARQQGFKLGILNYRMLVFKKMEVG